MLIHFRIYVERDLIVTIQLLKWPLDTMSFIFLDIAGSLILPSPDDTKFNRKIKYNKYNMENKRIEIQKSK